MHSLMCLLCPVHIMPWAHITVCTVRCVYYAQGEWLARSSHTLAGWVLRVRSTPRTVSSTPRRVSSTPRTAGPARLGCHRPCALCGSKVCTTTKSMPDVLLAEETAARGTGAAPCGCASWSVGSLHEALRSSTLRRTVKLLKRQSFAGESIAGAQKYP